MSKWQPVILGDYCEITSSKRIFYSDYVTDGVPFYRSKEIIERQRGDDISEPLFISNEKYENIKSQYGVPQANDMLLTSVGTIGIAYIVKETDNFYFKDGNLTWFRNFSPLLSSQYLYYWISSVTGQGILHNSTIGSSQKALTISALKLLKIPLPPIEVQRKIADILSAYDDLIENNRKQIKLLEEAAQRLYKEWFIDLRFPGYENTKIINGIPEGWEKTLLGNLIEIKYGKDHKHIPAGDIPVYGSGGFMRKCSQALHQGEAVLIPRKGSLNNIMYVNETFWTVDTMFYALMKQQNIGFFVYFLLKSFDMYAMDIGAAVPSMTTSILNAIDVVLPTATILDDFHNNANALFKRISTLNKQNDKLMESRDRLLKKLL